MGHKLLCDVAAATGLPEEMISRELETLIVKAGLDPAHLTLEDLRLVLAEYVQDVLLSAHSEFAAASGEG